MKTSIATALSVAGILVAGTAAALVNTQILDNGAPAGAASEAVLPPASSVDVTIPETSPTTTVAVASAAATSTTSPATTRPPGAAAPTGMLTTYTVGAAGSVTVDVVAGRVFLVSADPAPGWTTTEAEQDQDGGTGAEVKFSDGTLLVEFKVELIDGQLVPSVESSSVAQSATNPATSTVTTIDDEDDAHDADDDHGGDDADDDHGGGDNSGHGGGGDEHDDD